MKNNYKKNGISGSGKTNFSNFSRPSSINGFGTICGRAYGDGKINEYTDIPF